MRRARQSHAASKQRAALAAAILVVLCACDPLAETTDAGVPDGGFPQVPLDPIAMELEPVTFAAAPFRIGLAAAGQALFSSTPSGLERSVDLGATWQLISTLPLLGFQGDSAGRLIAFSNTELWVSDDSGGTFTSHALPSELGAPGRLFVSGDDAIWLLSQPAPFALARSVDHGASFSMTPAPLASSLLACTALGDALAFVVDGVNLARVTEDAVTVLGPVPSASACVSTNAGTVIVSAYDSTSVELLFTDDVTAPVRREVAQAFRYAGAGARVVRWGSNAVLAESVDHGETFTARDTVPPPPPFNLDALALVPGALAVLTQQGPASLADGATTWVVHPQPGLPPNPSPHDLAFAASSSGIAMLLDDNIQRTVYLARDGVTWRRGLTFPVADAQAIALDPTGTRVIVAGQLGGYSILGDDARTVLHADQIESAAGLLETDTIRSVTWGPDPAGSVILAASADDADTRGRLWQLDGEADHNTWLTLTPTETFESPRLREGGYHALAVSKAGSFEGGPPEDRALVASFRSFVSTGSFTTQLLTQFRLFDNNSSWDEAPPPVTSSAALSASWQAQTSRGMAMLWSENRLYFGRDMRLLREVPLSAGFPAARVVRFAPDGRLWIGTAFGVFRSVGVPTLEP